MTEPSDAAQTPPRPEDVLASPPASASVRGASVLEAASAEASPPGAAPRRRFTLQQGLVAVVVLAVTFCGGLLVGTAIDSGSDSGSGLPVAGRPGMPGERGEMPDGGPGSGSGEMPSMPGGRGGFTAGEIVSVEGATVTLRSQDGTEITVTTDDATTVQRTEEGDVTDLEVGDTVTVIGETGADGDVAASAITQGGFGGGFAGGEPPAAG